MSELKPGWADAFGLAQCGDSEAHSRMRRRKQKPFTEHTVAERLDAGRRASTLAHRSQRLDRVLGPVTED